MDSNRPAELQPGDRLDRYELLCKIGQGGMASVWLARAQGLSGFERLVAIKTVHPDHALDEAFRTMLLDEARIAAAIDHPNVARIHDVGEDRGVPFMVLDYIAGESLNRLHRVLGAEGRTVPEPIVIRVLADVCAGLHVAHELRAHDGAPLGIVHRDVSPQNVLVDDHGIAKLIDFGVAKAAGRMSAETATGIIKGKVSYMAPEQALGLPVDRRTDVYAVGAVAFYLVAGKAPFDADNDAARILRAVNGDAPDPLPSSVSPRLAAAILRALSRDPNARQGSCAELRAELEASAPCASHEDVARFFAQQLDSSVASRRKMIDRALGAAQDRQSQRHLLTFEPSTGSHSHPRVVSPEDETSVGTVGAVASPAARGRSRRLAALIGISAGLVVTLAFVGGALLTRTKPPAPTVGAGAPEGPTPEIPKTTAPPPEVATAPPAPPASSPPASSEASTAVKKPVAKAPVGKKPPPPPPPPATKPTGTKKPEETIF